MIFNFEPEPSNKRKISIPENKFDTERKFQNNSVVNDDINDDEKENVQKFNSNLNKSLASTKKMKITDDEKAMDGAPQGDIFDVTVMTDESILTSPNPLKELQLALNYLQTQSSWAEKYSAIESMRRIFLHHSSEVISNVETINIAINAAIESVPSLRSSISRNSIFFLKLLISENKKFELNGTQLSNMLSSLMNRTSCGPKFVCDSAYLVISGAIELLTFGIIFNSIKIFAHHKNADTSNKSFIIVSKSFISFQKDLNFLDFVTSNLNELLEFFGCGLNSKRAEGKQFARKSFELIKKYISREIIENAILNITHVSTQSILKCELSKEIVKIKISCDKNSVRSLSNARQLTKKSVSQNKIGGTVSIVIPHQSNEDILVFDSI
jgi:hypothetical protein